MPVNIDWKFEKPVATDRVLSLLESHFKIILPEDYKSLVKRYNGARPKPNVIKVGEKKERVIKAFLTVHPTKGGVKDVKEWLTGQIRETLIPFASDPFGNYFCFCYDNSRVEPEICFWSHETRQSEYLASSFNQFLKDLCQ
jgi:hypothetical protein